VKTVLSDPEIRANREASEIVCALRREVLGDNLAWRKLFHAGNYLDGRLDEILREPSMPRLCFTANIADTDSRCIPDDQSNTLAAC
jgi:hypothetical protein